jgi:hypothetical protein
MVCANEKARALTRALPAGLTLARRTAYFTLLKLFLLVLFVAIVILVVIILSVLLVLGIIPVLVGRVLALCPRIPLAKSACIFWSIRIKFRRAFSVASRNARLPLSCILPRIRELLVGIFVLLGELDLLLLAGET